MVLTQLDIFGFFFVCFFFKSRLYSGADNWIGLKETASVDMEVT